MSGSLLSGGIFRIWTGEFGWAAFNTREVARVLSDGGAFLTQQTSGAWAWDLQAAFGMSPQTPDVALAKYAPPSARSGA